MSQTYAGGPRRNCTKRNKVKNSYHDSAICRKNFQDLEGALFWSYRDPDLFFRSGIVIFVFLAQQLEVWPVIEHVI